MMSQQNRAGCRHAIHTIGVGVGGGGAPVVHIEAALQPASVNVVSQTEQQQAAQENQR